LATPISRPSADPRRTCRSSRRTADDASATLQAAFTHGEASTLGGSVDLARVRAEELAAASRVLGVDRSQLLAYPDGGLTEQPLEELAEHVGDQAQGLGADGLLVFDPGGITGHPDHKRATQAALTAADRIGLPVLAWAIPSSVTSQLNIEFGTAFVAPPTAISTSSYASTGLASDAP
jgi:LmbE family N-acetylglucosaminyl deacetylase